MRNVKGDDAQEGWPGWARLAFDVMKSDVAKQELDAVNATGEEVLKLPALGKQVVILSALGPMQDKSRLVADANEKRRDLLRLYPRASQIWVESGHGIPLEKPEAVISAIRKALEVDDRHQ